MEHRKRMSSTAAALLFAAAYSATGPQPAQAEPPPAASAAAPQAGSFLLTVFLRHDETKTLDQITSTSGRLAGRQVSARWVEIVARYEMMGIGQVVILRVPAEKLRDTNRVIAQTAWGGYRTEFHPTYDSKPVWDATPHHRR